MKYNFIKLKIKQIDGIKNPLLSLIGKVKKEDYDFEVEADGEKIPFAIKKDDEKFTLTSVLTKQQKKIKVYLLTDDEKYLIFNKRNSIFTRIHSKIIRITKIFFNKIHLIFHMFKKAINFFWKEYHFLVPPKMLVKYFKDFLKRVKTGGESLFYDPFDINEYNAWLRENENFNNPKKLDYNPLISILIPVYNIGKKYLSECLDSILAQTYENFEICLVDDCSTNEETISTLKEYSSKDKRIRVKYRKKNGHISATTNDALKMAKGEFCALVDDDDLLSPNALYEVVRKLNKDKSIDFIYSDEDKINLNGRRCDPHFKPDWSPDTLLSLNYICHLAVLRKSIMDEIGGFTIGLEGAQDHDLFLRFTEKTNNICHISKILYHWRMVEGSTALNLDNKDYANDKGKIAIENALKRRNIKAHVEKDLKSTYYRVVYELAKEPKVSIIIPTRDFAQITETCLKSLYEKTTYKNFEVILVNNNSVEKETFDLFEKYKNEYKNFKVLDANIEFNYSKINNMAVDIAKGDYIVLLNNDTEIITPEWLSIMVGYASQKHIGAVGPKLLYPDLTVQHAGVIYGLGGVASHAYIGSKREELGMYGRLRVPYDYGAVTAACLCVSKKKFKEVGGLEETLKVAYNDMDFNLKLLKKGYYNICVPQVELLHYESKSRGLDTTTEKYQRFLQESEFMWNKWENELNNDKFYNKNFTKKLWFYLDK